LLRACPAWWTASTFVITGKVDAPIIRDLREEKTHAPRTLGTIVDAIMGNITSL